MKAPRRAIAMLLITLAALAARAGDLAPHPDLVSGSLPCGLRYELLPRASDAGQLSLALLVRVGSMHEQDAESGYAFLIKEIATASAHEPSPEKLRDAFADVGVSLPTAFNGYTTIDHTLLWFTLPAGRPDAAALALRALSASAGRLSLPEPEIERARRTILEKGAGLSADYRLFSTALDRILPGSPAGQRPPWGRPGSVRVATREALLDFHRRWFVPSNCVLLAIGDFEPAALLDEVRRAFPESGPPPPDRPTDVALDHRPPRRAAIAIDEQQPGPVFEYLVAIPPAPGQSTAEHTRDELLRTTAAWLLERRVEKRLVSEGVAATKVASAVAPFAGAAELAVLSLSSTDDDWERAARIVLEEVARADTHGFTARELSLAHARAAAHAGEAADAERAQPASRAALDAARTVALGRTIRSAAQRVEFATAAAQTISLDTLNGAFRSAFDPSSAAFLLTHPDPERAPTEAALLRAAADALDAPTAQIDDEGRPTTILDSSPQPGDVAEFAIDPASGVVAAGLTNGLTVRHRAMTDRPGRVTLRIALAGGWMEENERTRGLTAAAGGALERPAAHARSAADLADLLGSRAIRLSVSVERDALIITVESSAQDLEDAMRAAHLLLREPLVEPGSFERWRAGALEDALAAQRQPAAALNRLITRALYPADEPRGRPLAPERIDAITRDDAQRWLDRLVREAPIEAAIVGDVDRAAAMRLAKAYLASLPARTGEPIGPDDPRRRVARAAGPIAIEESVRSPDPHAVAFVAIPAADARSASERLALDAAAHTLTARLAALSQSSPAPVLYPRAVNLPGEAFPGFGLLYAVATTPPQNAPSLVASMRSEIDRLAADGPTPREMQVAISELRADAERRLASTRHWADLLSTIAVRGRSIGEALREPERIGALTPEAVRSALASRAGPDGALSIIVSPDAPRE